MSATPVCAAPTCAKPATGEMVDAATKQFVAHVCSQACGVALIGMPKRAADDDDDARKRAAVGENPRELLRKQIRYSRALAVCYEIYSTLNKVIATAGRIPRWNLELTVLDATAKTLTIGSQVASAQTAQNRLNELIVKLIAALGNMQAKLPYTDVDIDGALKTIRDGLADEMTLDAFDDITNGRLRNTVVDDVRRMIARRANGVQVIARSGTSSDLYFGVGTVEFLEYGPGGRQYIVFSRSGSVRMFDQSFASADRVQYESTRTPMYRQSSHGKLGTSDQYSYRSSRMSDTWTTTYPNTINYRGVDDNLTATSRVALGRISISDWKVGKRIICGFYVQGYMTRFVVFNARAGRIEESSFDVRDNVSDVAIDSDGFIWTVNMARDRVTAYTQTGAEIGFLPMFPNDVILLYWAEREGVWILSGRNTAETVTRGQYALIEGLRARVAP